MLLIFRNKISSFLPPFIREDTFHLQVTSYLNETRKLVYEIAIKDSLGEYQPYLTFAEEDKKDVLPTSLNTSSFEEVRGYIDGLLDDGFFKTPKTALEIFDSCRGHFGVDFHPREMINVLNFYTNKKSGIPKLDKQKRNDFGRMVFCGL